MCVKRVSITLVSVDWAFTFQPCLSSCKKPN